MKYYIFQVKDSVGKNYYVINNRWLGYLGFDGNYFRATMETYIKPLRTYKLFASGAVKGDQELHQRFCDSERFNLKEAKSIARRFKLKLSRSKKWYEIVFPNPKSSESRLKEINCGPRYFDEEA
jgi:hypothetical protein